jgi:hypothetical protein
MFSVHITFSFWCIFFSLYMFKLFNYFFFILFLTFHFYMFWKIYEYLTLTYILSCMNYFFTFAYLYCAWRFSLIIYDPSKSYMRYFFRLNSFFINITIIFHSLHSILENVLDILMWTRYIPKWVNLHTEMHLDTCIHCSKNRLIHQLIGRLIGTLWSPTSR